MRGGRRRHRAFVTDDFPHPDGLAAHPWLIPDRAHRGCCCFRRHGCLPSCARYARARVDRRVLWPALTVCQSRRPSAAFLFLYRRSLQFARLIGSLVQGSPPNGRSIGSLAHWLMGQEGRIVRPVQSARSHEGATLVVDSGRDTGVRGACSPSLSCFGPRFAGFGYAAFLAQEPFPL
jgi:hypothetical protein